VTETEHFTVQRRFRGSESSGNGGYVSGSVARFVSAPVAEVTRSAFAPAKRSSPKADRPSSETSTRRLPPRLKKLGPLERAFAAS